MEHPRRFAAALVAVGLTAFSGAAQLPQMSAQAPQAGAITGTVYDGSTGQPVAGAIVVLSRVDGGAPIPRSVTDSKGRFVFRNLEPSDQYFLGARRFGYEYTRYGWSGPGQSLATADIARITVIKDQWVDNIRIPLWRLGSIGGRVLDERGEPLVGVAVRVFSQAAIAGQQQLVAGDVATTNDLGQYRVTGLKPGQYIVAVLSVQSTVLDTTPEAPQMRAVGQLADSGISAGLGGLAMPAVSVTDKHRLVISNYATPPPPTSSQSRAYPITFYPAGNNPAQAGMVEISWGTAQTGVDVHVLPVPAVKVSGRLQTPADEPRPQFMLRLMPIGMERLGFGTEAATTPSEPDGSFSFLNVPAGQYTLLAQPFVMEFSTGSVTRRVYEAPGFSSQSASVGSADGAPGLGYLSRTSAPANFWARSPLTVGAEDIVGLTVPLRRATSISGRIQFAENMTIPAGSRVVIRANPADGDPSLGMFVGVIDATKPGLTFTLDGLLAGTYLVKASFSGVADSATNSYRTASVIWRGRDVRDIGFDTSSGEDVRDVVINMTHERVELAGTVTGKQGPAVAAVIAFPTDRARWSNFGLDSMIFAATRSGSSGSFRIDRLAAGEYYVVACDISQRDAWVDPKFLAAAAAQASRVTLKWGDKQEVNLTVATVVAK